MVNCMVLQLHVRLVGKKLTEDGPERLREHRSILAGVESVLLDHHESFSVVSHEVQVLDAVVNLVVSLNWDLAGLLRDQRRKLLLVLVE